MRPSLKQGKEEKEEEVEEEEVEEEDVGEEGDSDTQSSDSDPRINWHRNIFTTADQAYSCPEYAFVIASWIAFFLTFPIAIFFCLRLVNEYERAVILRMGRLRPGGHYGPSGHYGPGIVFILPCIDYFAKLDLRTRSLDVPPQDILTKDSVTVNVDAVVYYRVIDPVDIMIQVMDVRYCVQLLCMTKLRNVTGSYTLTDLISSKKRLSRQIKSDVDSSGVADPWGVRIERVEITDIIMPESLQRAMAVEQEARREAGAKLAAANGERDAVKALKKAADIMESNPIALQLRYLQTLNTACNENTEAIVFPLPIDLAQKLFK